MIDLEGKLRPSLHASGTQTAVITTEHTLATAAVVGKFSLSVDKVNMAAGDVLELRIYRTTLTGGTPRVAWMRTYYGAQIIDDREVESPVFPNDLEEANALQFTLTQTFGTGRNFPWKVVKSWT